LSIVDRVVVGTQVCVVARSGMLRSQSHTVHSRVPVMCGVTASRCGSCTLSVTNHTRKWQAARSHLPSFLVDRLISAQT